MQIVHDYRHLHAIAETGHSLPATVAYLRRVLLPLNCRVWEPAEGSLCAWFDFGKPHALAFRADTDGLPIGEKTGLPWASVHPGCMHACGHDGHTAVLLELGRFLAQKTNIRHNVLLIFQCAEETDGGAEPICRTGVLEKMRCRAVFGLHLWPGLPKGRFYSRPGLMMSRGCATEVTFWGKTVHIAQARKGRDALGACARFYRRVEEMSLPGTVKFGMLHGGSAGNAVCGEGRLTGSIRVFSAQDLLTCQGALMTAATECARQTGCTGRVDFAPGYPAVTNDETLFSLVQQVFPLHTLNAPCLTTDDFSVYARRIPGLYTLLGVGNVPPLHSPHFAFDENILPLAADYYKTILTRLPIRDVGAAGKNA